MMTPSYTLDAAGRLKITGFEGLHLRSHAGGRLTLTSNTPITTSDVTAAASIYYTPFLDNQIALYDGSAWQLVTFSEKTLAIGTTTSARPHDVFGYLSAGELVLEHLVWTNDSTRATAITRQDGVYVKSGDATRRLLGTFYTTSTTQTADSLTARYLANVYNAVARPMFTCPNYNNNNSNTSYTFTGASYARINGGTNDTLNYVTPLDGATVELGIVWFGSYPTSGVLRFGPSVDSTSTPLCVNGGGTTGASGQFGSLAGTFRVSCASGTQATRGRFSRTLHGRDRRLIQGARSSTGVCWDECCEVA